MRKVVFLSLAAGLAAASVVALASASHTAKSVSPIATVRELEYGLSVSAPPVGAAESGVTVKPVAEEATAALFFAVTELAPAPVLEASKVTSMRLPVWEVEAKPLSAENA